MSSVRVFYPSHSREELIDQLRKRLVLLQRSLPLRRALLFGSWAKGRATVESDIDLLLIHEGAAGHEAYRTAWRILDIPGIELHLYAEDEADQLRATISRMTQDGIDLLDPLAAPD